jgi:hypothetical protein
LERVSIPALRFPEIAWAICLAFAAPVCARLGIRPHAWCFYGPSDGSGPYEAMLVAASVYGDRCRPKQWWEVLEHSREASECAEGLLVIHQGSSPEQTPVASALWLDTAGDDVSPGQSQRHVLSIIGGERRFDPLPMRVGAPAPDDPKDGWLEWHVQMQPKGAAKLRPDRIDRAPSKIWVLSLATTSIAKTDTAAAEARGARAMIAVGAAQSNGDVGAAWLMHLSWCTDQLVDMVFASELPDGSHDSAAPETGLHFGDVARLFALVATTGERATSQGLTGWPSGTATAVGMQMLNRWHESNASLLAEWREAHALLLMNAHADSTKH